MGTSMPSGLSDEKAARMMAALREGITLRKFGVKRGCPRFEAYCNAHPGYAREALPLVAANTRAANLRKGELKRQKASIVCLKGLHPMTGYNVRIHKGRRQCRECERIANKNPSLEKFTPDLVEKVKAKFLAGATVSQVCRGSPIGGGKRDPSRVLVQTAAFYRYRQLHPDFDRFVIAAIADSNSVGQQIRWSRFRTRAHTSAVRAELNDYHAIRAMLPANFPDKDDVVSAIFEDLLTGALKRENVKAHVQTYIAAHNRMFPTKYRKFGDSPLVSLDDLMFENGSTTRGDTVSRGLWD